MKITHIKLNGVPEPLGYDCSAPLLLSWLTEDAPGKAPARTRIEIQDPAGNLWVKEGQLDWEGTPLEPALQPLTRYEVSITVTDETGASAAGESWFETGRMDLPWTGQWIGPPAGTDGVPVLTGHFPCPSPVSKARLLITGLGLYRAEMNGQPVSDEFLTPGISDYETQVQYQTYGIAALLRPGDNRIAITLGNGWYKGRYGLSAAEPPFGDRFAALAEIRLTGEDGTEQVYGTDLSWTWTNSPIIQNGIYEGETLNRLATIGPERQVQMISIPIKVVPRDSLPIREKMVLPVHEVLRTPAGETVLDFGQNHTGLLRFHAALPKGIQVHFDFGEVLQGGNFYNDNYRGARGGFTYISDGRAETVCQCFTFYGFRYVRVSGWPGTLDPREFESPVLFSDLDEIGTLACGHPGIQRVLQNALWSQRSNFLDIPTDCPQRDERLGWTGDAQVFAPTACYFMDCRPFYRKFLRLLRSEQVRHDGEVPIYTLSRGSYQSCAIWSDAAVLIPDTLLRLTGSLPEAAQYYPMMKDWVDWVDRHHPDHLYANSFQFGDWLALDGVTENSFKGSTDDDFLATCYFYQSAAITAKLAGLLGKTEDQAHYSALAEQIRTAVLDGYVTPAGRLCVDTQTAYLTALRLNLVRDRAILLDQFRRRLRLDNYQIRCGFAGAPLLCQTLAQEGMDRIAVDILLNEGFPGWLYEVGLGATTIWERWNSLLPDGTCSPTGMNSFNHYSYGSVAEYVFAWVAGLRPAELGFRKAIIAPKPDARLGSLTCTCRTASGLFESSWTILPDGQLAITIQVPYGCTAEVSLPYSDLPPFQCTAGTYSYQYHPSRDLLALCDWDSRLGSLAGNDAAAAILAETVPQLAGALASQDKELCAQTFRELSNMDFMGLNEDNVGAAVSRLSALRITIQEGNG